jgi:tetratricopeptide (TPR) repeat protein
MMTMMKWTLWLLGVSIWPLNFFDQIGRNNLTRKQAEQAYQRADYEQAAAGFAYLSQKAGQADAVVWLDLGHAYFALGRYKEARRAYGQYIPAASGRSAAEAYTQLGVIACVSRDTTRALDLFRKALLTDPENEPARYNFELIKKQFSGRLRAKKTPQPTRKAKQTPQQQEQMVARSPRQEQVLRRLRNLNMTGEQANQLLNAMREDDLPLELARRRSAGQSQSSNANHW